MYNEEHYERGHSTYNPDSTVSDTSIGSGIAQLEPGQNRDSHAEQEDVLDLGDINQETSLSSSSFQDDNNDSAPDTIKKAIRTRNRPANSRGSVSAGSRKSPARRKNLKKQAPEPSKAFRGVVIPLLFTMGAVLIVIGIITAVKGSNYVPGENSGNVLMENSRLFCFISISLGAVLAGIGLFLHFEGNSRKKKQEQLSNRKNRNK